MNRKSTDINFNLEAEQSLLGAMMWRADLIEEVCEVVGESDFYLDSHRHIFSAIVELNERNERPDMVTVAEHLKEKGLLPEARGYRYIHTLASMVPIAANAPQYAQIVKNTAAKRTIVSIGQRLIELGREGHGEISAILEEVNTLTAKFKQEIESE